VRSEEQRPGAEKCSCRQRTAKEGTVNRVELFPERDIRTEDLQADEVIERHAGGVQDGAQIFHQVDDFLIDMLGHLGGAGDEADAAGDVERAAADQDSVTEGQSGITRDVFAVLGLAQGVGMTAAEGRNRTAAQAEVVQAEA